MEQRGAEPAVSGGLRTKGMEFWKHGLNGKKNRTVKSIYTVCK